MSLCLSFCPSSAKTSARASRVDPAELLPGPHPPFPWEGGAPAEASAHLCPEPCPADEFDDAEGGASVVAEGEGRDG